MTALPSMATTLRSRCNVSVRGGRARVVSWQGARKRSARLRTVEQAREAGVIKGQLIQEDPAPHARDALRAAPRMPAGAPPPRGGRQIKFRLGPQEHARLVEAAKLFAMRPATLARTLTVRGVERALYEERRER